MKRVAVCTWVFVMALVVNSGRGSHDSQAATAPPSLACFIYQITEDGKLLGANEPSASVFRDRGTDSERAASGMQLAAGDRVRSTSAKSTVSIKLERAGVLQLPDHAIIRSRFGAWQVMLVECSDKLVKIKLLVGEIVAIIRSTWFEVEAGLVVAGARGTKFLISFDASSQSLTLFTLSGNVNLTHRGSTFALPALRRATVVGAAPAVVTRLTPDLLDEQLDWARDRVLDASILVESELLRLRGKAVTAALSQFPTQFDPSRARDLASLTLIANTYETLVTTDTNGVPRPLLAESWDLSPDGLTYEFNLRRNVRFHDGAQFNSGAVRRSIERQTAPLSIFSVVKEIRAIDSFRLRISLSRPSARFLSTLASPAASIISPLAMERLGGAFAARFPGTGPYRFLRAIGAGEFVLERNENHWRADMRASLPQLVVIVATESVNTRLQMLRSGELDVAVEATSRRGTWIEAGPAGFRTTAMPVAAVVYAGFDTRSAAFSDPRIRSAIVFATNQQQLATEFALNVVTATGPIPPGFPGHAPNLRIVYDPARAKRLIQEAGHDKITFRMAVAARPDILAVATGLKKQWEGVGFLAELRMMNLHADLIPQVRLLGADAWLSTLSVTGLDPSEFVDPFVSPESAMNEALLKYDDANVMKLLSQAAIERDPSKRAATYRAIQTAMTQNPPALFLLHPRVVLHVAPRVKQYEISPPGALRLYRIFPR